MIDKRISLGLQQQTKVVGLNVMSFDLIKKWKFDVIIGEQGGRRMRYALQCIFCDANLFLTPTPFILKLILVLQLQKKNLGRISHTEELNKISQD